MNQTHHVETAVLEVSCCTFMLDHQLKSRMFSGPRAMDHLHLHLLLQVVAVPSFEPEMVLGVLEEGDAENHELRRAFVMEVLNLLAEERFEEVWDKVGFSDLNLSEPWNFSIVSCSFPGMLQPMHPPQQHSLVDLLDDEESSRYQEWVRSLNALHEQPSAWHLTECASKRAKVHPIFTKHSKLILP